MKTLNKLFLTMLAIFSLNIFAAQEAPRVDESEKIFAESIMATINNMGEWANKANEYKQIIEKINEKYKENQTKLYHQFFVTLLKAANEACKRIQKHDAAFLIFMLLEINMSSLIKNCTNATTIKLDDSKDKLTYIISKTIFDISLSINKMSEYISIVNTEIEQSKSRNYINDQKTDAQLYGFLIKQLIKVAKEHQEITGVLAGETLFRTLYMQIKGKTRFEILSKEVDEKEEASQNNSSSSSNSSSSTKFKPFSGTPHTLG